jgi:DNA-binding HxlR family transcriptional regulator
MAHDKTQTTICASEVVIRTVRSRWAPTLLKLIADHEPIHFSAILRKVAGISTKVLADQLRNLQRDGVLHRSRATRGQEVFYELTNRGRELKRALDGLNDLADRWQDL